NNSYLLSFKSKKRDLTGLECGSSHPFYNNLPGNVLLSRNVSPTTIGAKELNFCVRHGNRCDLFAIVTRQNTCLRKSFTYFLINCDSSSISVFSSQRYENVLHIQN